MAATKWALRLIGLVSLAGIANAEDTVSLRGAYYKEKATRVIQPMVDLERTVTDDGVMTAHFAVDAITSASVSAGAAEAAFTETRVEGGVGYAHAFGRLTLSAAFRYSTEPDYKSRTGSLRARVALAEDNTYIDFGITGSHDSLSNAGAQTGIMAPISGTLTTALGSIVLTQVLSTNAIASFNYDVSRLAGFQQNPYRTAITNDGLLPERHPDLRYRHAVAGSARYFWPRTETTFIGVYRYYIDSWGIAAHTPELRIVQTISEYTDAALRLRYYWQSAADFYARVYASGDPTQFPFITDDPKMDAFSVATIEAKLGFAFGEFGARGRLEHVRFEGSLQYAAQSSRFSNAIMAQSALIFPW